MKDIDLVVLNEAIKESGLSTKDLCDSLNISKTTLYNWKSVKNLEQTLKFIQYIKILDVDVEEILKEYKCLKQGSIDVVTILSDAQQDSGYYIKKLSEWVGVNKNTISNWNKGVSVESSIKFLEFLKLIKLDYKFFLNNCEGDVDKKVIIKTSNTNHELLHNKICKQLQNTQPKELQSFIER